MKKHKERFRFLQVAVISVTAILLLIVMILAGFTENVITTENRPTEKYTLVQSFSYVDIEAADAPIGIVEEYCFRVPDDLWCDTYLNFYLQHQLAQVSMDGVCFYRITLSGSSKTIKTPGCNWVSIPIYREDAGKEMRVIVTPVYQRVFRDPVEFIFSSKEDVMLMQLRKDIISILICIMLIFTGVAMLACSIYYHRVFKQGLDILSYSVLAICIGIWRGLDHRLVALILPGKPVLCFYISLGAMMLGMIPFSLAQKKRIGSKLADGYTVLVALTFGILTLLQLTGIADLFELIVIIQMMMIVGFLNLLIMEMINQKRNHSGISIELIISLLLCIGAVLDFTIYHVKHNSITSNCLLVAQLIIIMINEFYYMRSYGKQTQSLVLQENEIIKGRLTVLASQVRSHFVYNILNDISGMCKYDAKKADRAIICFARYLRSNIDVMQEDEPVLFLKALSHLEEYWELVRIRYQDKYQFRTQIEVDQFFIPPMVLQPLVENAIKHGFAGKIEDGTITLRTWMEDGKYKISIEDNGVGFDPETVSSKSVGIRNVRSRLQYMVNGELDIISKPGEGTKAVITVPRDITVKKQEESS